MTKTKIEPLARRFAQILKDWLTPEERVMVLARNAKAYSADPDYNTCASGDFCDSNTAMLEAWQAIFSREPDFLGSGGDYTPDTELWNEAWDHAKRSSFWWDTPVDAVGCLCVHCALNMTDHDRGGK